MEKYAIILAGGMGKRLWPLSRRNMPKQFLEINGKNMIERTIERLETIFKKRNTFIITRKELKEKIIESRRNIPLENIIVEKETMGTACAIAVGVETILKKSSYALVSIFPSDSYIEDEIEYMKAVKKALSKAENENKIIVIGVKPQYPSSGMGYIQCEKVIKDYGPVAGFIEKPSNEKAKVLLKAKNYYWNTGVVISTVQTLKNEILRIVPQLFMRTEEKVSEIKGSFDELILEKTSNIGMVIGRFKWEDLGTFEKFKLLTEQDSNGNTMCKGAMYIESKDIICVPKEKKIIIFGAENLIIIENSDVILIMKDTKSQEMEKVVSYLEEKQLNELL